MLKINVLIMIVKARVTLLIYMNSFYGDVSGQF